MMMTPADLLLPSGFMIFLGGLLAPLLSRFFCVRPVPGWLRHWRDLALALVGARLVGAATLDLPLDWFSALLYLHLGLAQAAVAAANWRYVLGPDGDRCWSDPPHLRVRGNAPGPGR